MQDRSRVQLQIVIGCLAIIYDLLDLLLPYTIVKSVVHNNCEWGNMVRSCSEAITDGILTWVFTAKYHNVEDDIAMFIIGTMAGHICEMIQHILTWTVFIALLAKTMIASKHLFLAPFKLRQLFDGKPKNGGLASAAAIVSGFHADTFNAAGLHSATVPRFLNGDAPLGNANNITAYRTESDELTELQEGNTTGWFACNAAGIKHWLEDDLNDDDTNASSQDWPGHEMSAVIQGLLVDRISKERNIKYIIDYHIRKKRFNKKSIVVDRACYDGIQHESNANTVLITDLYAE